MRFCVCLCPIYEAFKGHFVSMLKLLFKHEQNDTYETIIQKRNESIDGIRTYA